jgi:hypothetical protein
MQSPDVALRRRVVALLAVSVESRTFTPKLINSLSELFEVERSVIYSDLRSLEPRVGCLLENAKKTFSADMLKALSGMTPEDRRELRQAAREAGVPLEYLVWALYNRHARKLQRRESSM